MQKPACNWHYGLFTVLSFSTNGVNNMNKAELIDAVAKSTKNSKASVEETLNALMAAVQSSW